MSATANRPRAAKIKPPRIETPLASVISRIASARTLIGMAIDAAETGDHIEMVLTGLEENLLPGALASLHGTSVTKADVDKAHCKLFFPLSVLYAAQVLSMGLVMESTLQQAFETLDRAHSDMDSALVAKWSLPEGADAVMPMARDDDRVAAVSDDKAMIGIERAAGDSVHGLPLAVKDQLGSDLHMTRAAVQMLNHVFAGNGPEEPRKTDGLMGVLQYVNATLKRSKDIVQDSGIGTEGFYFGVFHAASLASMLEEILWADSWDWNFSPSLYCDYFSAILSGIDAASGILNERGAS